jgi:hypothetical protein
LVFDFGEYCGLGALRDAADVDERGVPDAARVVFEDVGHAPMLP